MEIKHWVETTEDEASDLYMMVVSIATESYASVAEQNAAILSAMPEFKAALDELVSEAYRLGRMKSKKSKDLVVTVV
jgi:phosphoglycolate phosphatase-like HAD superfamily hydrolase